MLATTLHSQDETNELFPLIWPETQVTTPKVFRERDGSVNTPTNDAITYTKVI
jgi:hypothetical protein